MSYPTFLDDTYADPACRGVSIDVFFPGKGGSVGRAKALCARCPLRVECRDWALEQPSWELFGVWGGLSETERKDMHRKRVGAGVAS